VPGYLILHCGRIVASSCQEGNSKEEKQELHSGDPGM